jgi:charged multivesicular body protein 1
MFGGGDARMMEQIFNLKFTSKQLVRQSLKCEREEKDEKLKARVWAPFRGSALR